MSELPKSIIEILEKYQDIIDECPVTFNPFPEPRKFLDRKTYEDYKEIEPFAKTIVKEKKYICALKHLHSAAQMLYLINRKPSIKD